MKTIKFITVVLALILMIGGAHSLYADSEISPLWNYTGTVNTRFEFDGLNANVILKVVGKVGCTKISADIDVYQKVGNSWELVEEFSESVSSRSLYIDTYITGERNTEYKTEFIITTYVNNASEVIYDTIYKTCK